MLVGLQTQLKTQYVRVCQQSHVWQLHGWQGPAGYATYGLPSSASLQCSRSASA